MKQEEWQVEWVPIESISLDPDNTNTHPQDQIDLLSEGMTHYGWIGNPVVANLDRVCKAGEGRLLSAKKAGLKKVPVHFKKFANSDDESAWSTFDNGISKWASIDFAKLNTQIGALGPDFDIKFLGVKDFVLEPADKELKPKEKCPACGR